MLQSLIHSIRNRHNEKPIDLLPASRPGADPESDDEKVRAALRRAEAEAALGAEGDVVDGECASGVMMMLGMVCFRGLWRLGFGFRSGRIGRTVLGGLMSYTLCIVALPVGMLWCSSVLCRLSWSGVLSYTSFCLLSLSLSLFISLPPVVIISSLATLLSDSTLLGSPIRIMASAHVTLSD